MDGPGILGFAAQIGMMAGQSEKATDHLQYLLSIPSAISVQAVRADPVWAPLRRHPRFQRLLDGGI